ncbi:Uncharacterized protein FWK35_00018685 [Aphis craccivora]|uniref:Uncharacterized protein n=1 Tax=Aphis craccivora TaxID=307492 RepID=A0A6G0YQ96_APHCR|nr:Uncharacterized protein FWK35_00018685 [Aphis craccivora]
MTRSIVDDVPFHPSHRHHEVFSAVGRNKVDANQEQRNQNKDDQPGEWRVAKQRVKEAFMPKSTHQLFQRVLFGKIKNYYPPELKSFALTLNLYSANKWYESVDCSPGFSKEALVALQNKVKEAKLISRRVVYVDFGADIANDCTPEAKEALVIMVNYVNGCWKMPI